MGHEPRGALRRPGYERVLEVRVEGDEEGGEKTQGNGREGNHTDGSLFHRSILLRGSTFVLYREIELELFAPAPFLVVPLLDFLALGLLDRLEGRFSLTG